MNSGFNLLYVAIVCGLIAVLYGIITSRQVLGMSAGNQRMMEVSAAIQEGAGAYLRRQYTTILIVGVVVIESVFVYPGIGQYMVDGVSKRDLPVVQACGLVFAAAFVILNTVADVLSILVNPRLRKPR